MIYNANIKTFELFQRKALYKIWYYYYYYQSDGKYDAIIYFTILIGGALYYVTKLIHFSS